MPKIQKLFFVVICVLLLLTIVPRCQPVSSMVTDDDIVDIIIIEDPAELGGEPNDISEFTVWTERCYSESKQTQIRVVAWKLRVHSRFEGSPYKPFYFVISMRWNDQEGMEHSQRIGYYMTSGFTGNGWLYNDSCSVISPFNVTGIEEVDNVKINFCQVRLETGYLVYDDDTKEFSPEYVDTTRWSTKRLDITDNRPAKNVEKLSAVVEGDCVKLTWKKPEMKKEEMDYNWYRIYRDDKRIMTVYNDTEFIDCEVAAGETYKYTVKPLTEWLVEGGTANCKIAYDPKTTIEIDQEEINFGTLESFTEASQKISLSNTGSVNADIKFETDATWFVIQPSELSLNAGETTEVQLTTITEKMTPKSRHQGGIVMTWGTDGYLPLFAQAKVSQDTTPPKITIDPLEHVSNANSYTVYGHTEPGCRVLVNNIEAITKNDGSFKVEIPLNPAPSKTPVKVWSSDKFGNATKETLGEIINILNRNVAMTIGTPIMTVDNENKVIDPPPTIIQGRTMVPVRAIAESFGAEVSWEGSTKTVTINLYGNIIKLQIGNTTAVAGGIEKVVDPPAQILSGRTMVPFRFIAEALGATVDWDGDTKTITMKLELIP